MSKISLTPVQSSQIAAIGHDPNTNTLAVQFHGKGDAPGSIYHYSGFSADDYKAFSGAESKGSFFIRNIKNQPKKYPYAKQEAKQK